MHREHHIGSHHFHKVVHSQIEILFLSRIKEHKSHIYMNALHLLQLFMEIFTHPLIIYFWFSSPYPVVQISCMIDPLSFRFDQKRNTFICGFKSPDLHTGSSCKRYCQFQFFSRTGKIGFSKKFFRHSPLPDIIRKYKTGLFMLSC